jgi:hypothetical protein
MRGKCLLKYKLTMSLNTNFYLDAYTRPENELLSNRLYTEKIFGYEYRSMTYYQKSYSL